MSDSRRGNKEWKLNFLTSENPHKIEKTEQTMKRWLKIAVWTAVAVAGAILTRTNILWWLIVVSIGKFAFRLILTLSLAIILYVLFYALIIGGLFWVLIS